MQLDAEILFEPGRFLTANGGTLLADVLYTKSNSLGKNFVVINAAMTDLLRPSLYKSYHHVQPVEKIDNVDFLATDEVKEIAKATLLKVEKAMGVK